jgi:diguanylate cyclase (GGDEF)-like protein
VNDEHGHLAGDKVIAAFAGMIGQMTRPVDVTGRIGGEEFCILVSTCDLHYAANLAERIRIAFAASGGAGAGAGADRPACTASFGVAQSRPEDTLRSLFERADAALYEAKGTGRNRVIRQAREAGETPASSGNDKGNAQKLPGAAYASSKQRRSA